MWMARSQLSLSWVTRYLDKALYLAGSTTSSSDLGLHVRALQIDQPDEQHASHACPC